MRQRAHTPPVVPDSLTDYLDGIGKYRILTRDEEMALGRRIRAGDTEAVNELVCANLRFVVTVAKQYNWHGVSFLDIIDEGNLGLIRAARKFDERKGIKFISYAVWWIRQAIQKAVMQQSRMVRLPSRHAANLYRLGRRANTLVQRLGRQPTQSEIAEDLNISEQEVASTMSMTWIDLSLDAPLRDDDRTLLECVADNGNVMPDEETSETSQVAAVTEALSRLRPRDAEIVRMYFGLGNAEPMTLEDIGTHLGITRERVRQIRDRALRILRKTLPDLTLDG